MQVIGEALRVASLTLLTALWCIGNGATWRVRARNMVLTLWNEVWLAPLTGVVLPTSDKAIFLPVVPV